MVSLSGTNIHCSGYQVPGKFCKVNITIFFWKKTNSNFMMIVALWWMSCGIWGVAWANWQYGGYHGPL